MGANERNGKDARRKRQNRESRLEMAILWGVARVEEGIKACGLSLCLALAEQFAFRFSFLWLAFISFRLNLIQIQIQQLDVDWDYLCSDD